MMWNPLRCAVRTVIVAAAIGAAAGGSAGAVALNACVDAPFGTGSLTCTVDNKTEFSGLDPNAFPGTPAGTFKTGPNDKEADVEAALNHVLGRYVDLTSVSGELNRSSSNGFTLTPTSGHGQLTAFDWSYAGSATLAYLSIKAGDAFAIFDINGQIAGSAGTDNLLVDKKGKPVNIAHVSFWGIAPPSGPAIEPPTVPLPSGPEAQAVSSPGILALAGGGLLGIVALRRRHA
ncbi:MAG: hypothetical protein KDC18_17910 [Alphaproteobacteria bacterium]|nr:hypothetical protein [Alphaproteobacteria bacterium]MCB9931560.1 hypothetical protein [Alphaproteobacteria bacterium]